MRLSAIILVLLSALVGLVHGRPTLRSLSIREWQEDCPALTSYYVCAANGFKGCSSFDPCSAPAYVDASSPTPNPAPTKQWQACPAKTSYYVCAANGFKGCSSFDPCSPPANVAASASLSTREWKDCPAKTSYYACAANGFKGCSSFDPCSLSTNQVATNMAATPAPQCTPGRNKLYQPSIHNIDPNSPDAASTMNAISVSRDNDGANVHDQLIVFSGLPSTANNCSLSWSVGAGQTFYVNGTGLTDARALTGPVPTSITFNTVDPIMGDIVGTPDFKDWNTPNRNEEDHIVGDVVCSAEMAFKFGISGDAGGSVQLLQNADTGFYVEYSC